MTQQNGPYLVNESGQTVGFTGAPVYESEKQDKKGGGPAMGPVDIAFICLILGLLALSAILKFIGDLPWNRFVMILTAIAVCVGVLVLLWCIRFVRRRPKTAIITVVAIVGGLYYLGTLPQPKHDYSNELTAGQKAALSRMTGAQRSQVVHIDSNGVDLYEMFASPNTWTDPIVLKEGSVSSQVHAAGDVRISADGAVVDPANFSPHAGMALRFSSASDKVVPITLRVFTHQPTVQEMSVIIPLPLIPDSSSSTMPSVAGN